MGWNVRDDREMIYHHMDEEAMYPQESLDRLMDELITLFRTNLLSEKKIRRLFGEEVDTEYMREFWKKRAHSHKLNEALTNLEDDAELLRLKMQKERPKMASYIQPNKDMVMLDLGSGYGTWIFEFANQLKMVYGVDYIGKMVKLGENRAKDEGVDNVKFFESSVQDYTSNIKYDLILLSGVCLYLNDADMRELVKNISGYSEQGTVLVLRDGTGVKDRYTIEKEYSERLQTMYSATYRTREEYIMFFKKAGFILVKDEDMFEEGSPFNRFKETKLRIYKFRKK